MGASFNQVLLMGNMTRDIEVRYTPANTAVGQFALAINRTWTTPQGEKREEVSFIDCEAWGKAVEIMKQDTWEDKNGGGKRSKIKVVVEDFRLIGGRGQTGGGPGGGGAAAGNEYDQSAPPVQSRSNRAPAGAAPIDAPPIGEEDIPF